MKLKVKYLFPTSSSGTKFYIYQLPERLGMTKILAHGKGCKRIHKTRHPFLVFSRIFMELCGSKVQLALPDGKLINCIANPKIVYSTFLVTLLFFRVVS